MSESHEAVDEASGTPAVRRAATGRPPTMVDVASAAGVALKTVSRFVNGETNIDPVLAGRIADAIEELGYRRNLRAASIRPGWTSKVVGLIISDLANPYYSALARAIESVASANGYLLTTVSSEEDGERHDRAIDRLIEQRVDALLVVPPRKPGRPWPRVRPPVPPVVFLDRPADLASADTVLADNAGGARDATSQLARGGARRIAFVGDSLDISTMRERFAGYTAALHAHDLQPDPALMTESAHDTDEARAAIRALLDAGSADAIFAANNRAAIGALQAFAEAGMRVPLIAFDDFEAATLVRPAVSVVAQDVVTMGRTAMQLALARMADRDAAPQLVTLPTSLVLRGSDLADRAEAAAGSRPPTAKESP